MSNAGYLKLGKWEFPSADAPRVKVVVKFKGSAKVEKKEAKGKDDAKTSYSGRKPRDVDITISWPEWEPWREGDGKTPEDTYVRKALKELNPAGPKGGEPWEVTHVDAELFDVGSIVTEELDLEREEGTNKATAKVKAASWVKPAPTAQGGGKAKTATDPNAWKLGTPQPTGPKGAFDAKQFGGGGAAPAVTP